MGNIFENSTIDKRYTFPINPLRMTGLKYANIWNKLTGIVLRNWIYLSLSVNIVELYDFMAQLSFPMHPPPIKEIDCYKILTLSAYSTSTQSLSTIVHWIHASYKAPYQALRRYRIRIYIFLISSLECVLTSFFYLHIYMASLWGVLLLLCMVNDCCMV